MNTNAADRAALKGSRRLLIVGAVIQTSADPAFASVADNGAAIIP